MCVGLISIQISASAGKHCLYLNSRFLGGDDDGGTIIA